MKGEKGVRLKFRIKVSLSLHLETKAESAEILSKVIYAKAIVHIILAASRIEFVQPG